METITKLIFSDEMIKVINCLCDKFGVVIDWTSSSVIPYLQELAQKFIHYRISIDIFWLCFTAFLVIIGIILIICDVKDVCPGSSFIGLICIIIAIILACVKTVDIITCNTFPEKILLETLKNYLD